MERQRLAEIEAWFETDDPNLTRRLAQGWSHRRNLFVVLEIRANRLVRRAQHHRAAAEPVARRTVYRKMLVAGREVRSALGE